MPNPLQYDTVMAILRANSKKNFVQRILTPDKFPVIDNEDGTRSTHKMASGEADGRFYAYPTIVMRDGKLEDLGPEKGFDYALESGELIEFPDEEQADWFARHYKVVWGDE